MNILLADDECMALEILTDEVKKLFPDASVDAFADGVPAWEAARQTAYDLVIIDVFMRKMNGPELAARIHERSPKTRILFVTGEIESKIEKQGISLESCLFKPFWTAELKEKTKDLAKDT